MTDFTSFNWETGDYGEAAKFNSMLDNDRHLRERTDFLTMQWGRSVEVGSGFSPGSSYTVRIGGVTVASGSFNESSSSVSHVNVSISSIPIGLRTIEFIIGSTTVFTGRVCKTHDLDLVSLWIQFGFVNPGGNDPDDFIQSASMILHRQWQSW
jgi:hypothetical protein